MKPTVRRWLAALMLAAVPFAVAAQDDAGAIRHLMMETFDKPEAPLLVDPVTVQGDLAVAGWAQGDMGGRALLLREDGSWELSLCAGDALRDPVGLAQLGLSTAEADALATAVVAAEAPLDPALVAKFSSFEGVVRMGDDGSHPAGHDGSHGTADDQPECTLHQGRGVTHEDPAALDRPRGFRLCRRGPGRKH